MRRATLLRVLAVATLVLALAPAAHAEAAAIAVAQEEAPTALSPWFLMAAMTNVYPELGSERLIRRYFDGSMRMLAPGYDDVKTVGDLRDMGLLWTPYVGFGRTIGRRWALFFQCGYAAGKVSTRANDRSIILLPLHTQFDLRRGALYGGFGFNYYPAGRAEPGPETGFKNAKFFVGSRFMVTEATYNVKAKIRFKPFPNLIRAELSDRWVLPSIGVNVGVDVPVSGRSVVELNAGYNFFMGRSDDFNSVSLTAAFKFFLKGSQ